MSGQHQTADDQKPQRRRKDYVTNALWMYKYNNVL